MNKNFRMYIELIIVLILVSAKAFASDGSIKGVVIDNEGVSVIGAYVIVDNIEGKGTVTDIDGNFILKNLKRGVYSITVSYISLGKRKIKDIKVSDDVIDLGTIKLGANSIEMQEVVVTARAINNSENSVQTLQRKSLNTIDGISSQSFSITGDSDAGAAMKRVIGVSVQDGKYVFIRGLGGRYSMTTVNGMSIPGLDPDKNSVEMDIFPTNTIDNIIVYKSFTPDLPGSFTGGLVDIKTKDFPAKLIAKLSFSLGYNRQANFVDGFISHEGSTTDWLGFDDGSREIPKGIGTAGDKLETSFAATHPDEANKLVRKFNKNVEIKTVSQPMNYKFGLSFGNQVEFFGKTLGFNASISYKRDFSYYNNGLSGRYFYISSEADTLKKQRIYNVEKGVDQVFIGSIINASYKLSPFNKIGFTLLHNNSGRKITRAQGGYRYDENIGYKERLLSYQSRDFNTMQLRGNHAFGENQEQILSWGGSFSFSKMKQPDLRFLNYAIIGSGDEKTYSIQPSIGLIPTRYWRDLNEKTSSNRIAYSYSFHNRTDRNGMIKFGASYDWKYRIFKEHIYQFESLSNEFNGNFSDYFDDKNLISSKNQKGIFVTEASNPKNNYSASSNIWAGYAMVELPLTAALKTVVGARIEKASIDFNNSEISNKKLLNNLDVLPASGLIYEIIKEKMNLRFNYNQTVARPVFREIADVAFYEFLNNSFLLGNPDLKRTLIHNFDFRWEYFFDLGEKITVSTFYKKFYNPIELTNNPEAKNGEWIYKNVDHAMVYGVELEVRKKLKYVSFLRGITIGGNMSLVKSKASIPPGELANIRYHNPDAIDTRQLYGQSPYLINGFVSYENTKGTIARLSYNVQGERLYLIQTGAKPDVFEQPFHLLNLKISQKIGKRIKFSLKLKNILNQSVRRTIKFKNNEYVYNSYKSGISYSFGLNYDLY